MEIPAVWTVPPSADHEDVDDLLNRLAQRLDIEKPEIKNDQVLLPAEYPKVAKALGEVEPGWEDEGLLIPPEA
ncbi:hypothetical protein BH20ACT18_BH20ACT18_08180 [soil metagenome]|jgi:hypothetical protein